MGPKTRSKTRKGAPRHRGTLGWLHTHNYKIDIALYAALPFAIDLVLFITIEYHKLEASWVYRMARLYNTAISATLFITSDALLLIGLATMCYGGVKYWRQRKTTEGLRIGLYGIYTVFGAITVVYWLFTVSVMFEMWLKYNMVRLDIPFKDSCDGWMYPCLDDLADGYEL